MVVDHVEIIPGRDLFRERPDIAFEKFSRDLKRILEQKYERIYGNDEPTDGENINHDSG